MIITNEKATKFEHEEERKEVKRGRRMKNN